jgi:hypothetical protein
MKIGIISMQRVTNYGSFLQAYGLKTLIERLGHDVVFIDFKPGQYIQKVSLSESLLFMIRIIPIRQKIRDFIKIKKKQGDFWTRYRYEYLPVLGVGYRRRYNTKVDIAVIGSDEVFNCTQKGPSIGFSPMLFGQDINCKKVISYAASFGHTSLASLKSYGIEDKVSSYLKSFSRISVRDENSREIVKKLTKNEPEINLDPVLISDFPEKEGSIRLSRYAILYTYGSRKYEQYEIEAILKFCEDNRLQLVSFGNCQKWVPTRIEADPFELLGYFKNASFVITDTFHGTVLSIKFNKNFACRIREDNDKKLRDLLKRLNMENRTIDNYFQLNDMYALECDYTITNKIIEREKEHTISYLREAMTL